MIYEVKIEVEGTNRDMWELEDRICGLKELNGVKRVTFEKED